MLVERLTIYLFTTVSVILISSVYFFINCFTKIFTGLFIYVYICINCSLVLAINQKNMSEETVKK